MASDAVFSKQRAAQACSACMRISEVIPEYAQHAPQRFGRAPEQLIANCKGAEKLRPHVQLVEATDRYTQRTGNGRRSEAANARFFVVGDQFHPGVAIREYLFNVTEWDVLDELDAEPLTMASHRSD